MQIPGYKIERPIGQGGMATAYLAVQESLGRKVVIKVLNTTREDSPHAVERFLNEGRLVAALNHPHIITIYDVGIADEIIYLSMEYVEGGDLRDRMRSPVTPAEAIDIVLKIGSALDAAHRQGIVHRDVKPANILFRKDGTPLLTDFGIAKQMSIDHDLTSTGFFLGSPNYMAPEQAESGRIDGRADIYSLGVILYEMLTGQKPYRGESVIDIVLLHKQAPIPRLPNELAQYQPLLDLMMAKRPRDRFRDAAAMTHYIANMQATGVTQIAVAPVAAGDMSQTGEHSITAASPIMQAGTPRRAPYILIILLFITASAFGWLLYLERAMNRDPAPRAPLAAGVDQVLVLEPAPAPAPPASTAPDPATEEVMTALSWLARNSLEDYRLTYPPRDNAYYYFSRLLELDPGNAAARRGLLEVAERFAFLAERELASGNYEKAQTYISIGLQIDAENRALNALQELAQPRERGLLKSLRGLFGS